MSTQTDKKVPESFGKRQLKRAIQQLKIIDKPVLIITIILLIVGLMMVYTASSYLAISQDLPANSYLIRQFIFVLIGFLPFFGFYFMNIDKLQKRKTINIMVSIMLILLLIVLFIGEARNGARGWLSLGPVSLQPIELAKPLVVIVLATLIAQHQREITANGYKALIKKERFLVFSLLGILIITFLFPDFGGMTLVASIMLLMILGSGISSKWFKRFLLIAVIGYIVMLVTLNLIDLSHIDNYQIRRFVSFANPFAYAQSDGLQLVNSYYALAVGGFFGQGPGNSIQKTGYLPEAHNDFIMAIIGEEFGFIVVLVILMLYFALIVYLYLKAAKTRSIYHQMILIGVASYFFMQLFINLGGITGLIPITGVTLPFLSYGGSSLLATSMMLGLALSALRRDFQMKHKRPVMTAYNPTLNPNK